MRIKLAILNVLFSINMGFTACEADTINKLPTVAIFLTGGTIAEKTDPKTGASIPIGSSSDLIEHVPVLKEIANLKVVQFSNIDSSHMTPQIWAKLSKQVDAMLQDPDIKGVVIAHGTDTMAEGAFFLELTLKTNKPVVFTGAVRDASDPYSDGPPNLRNAVVQVCSDNAQCWGVTVTLNEYINAARNVIKTQTTNRQTFESGEKGYLGYVYNKKVYRYNNRLKPRLVLPIPKDLPRVDIIMDYAGTSGFLVKYAVDCGAKGIVVQSVGDGNVDEEMYDAIVYAMKKGAAVVISTRVFYGAVYPSYGDIGGGESLKQAGAIVVGDLPAPKARLLLMLALPLVKEHHELNKYFEAI